MKKSPPSSITIEEAVSRMVNMDYIPTGFSLLDMAEAFLEEAEVDYHNAKVDRVPPEDLKICALRVNVCTSRHLLAVSLLDHLKQELANPKTSSLIISPETTSSTRLELKSIADWSEEKYGISIPDWHILDDVDCMHSVDDVTEHSYEAAPSWATVTIKIYKEYSISCFIGKEQKRSHFRSIGLMGDRKNEPNFLGGILLGLSRGVKFPIKTNPECKDKTALSKIRKALKSLTDISEDPFYPINDSDGWKPIFKLIDDRKNADVRAKQRAVHVSYQAVENYQAETKRYDLDDDIEAKSFDDEDDEAGAWLAEND
jgi:hypothetical protein